MKPLPPPAFATITALIMLALFGSVVLMLTTHLRAQVKRTVRDADDAQLRQLLHAGGMVASDFPKVWNTSGVQRQAFDVPVPPDLQARPAAIKLTVVGSPDGATARATVTATLDARTASETILFTKDPSSGWRLSGLDAD